MLAQVDNSEALLEELKSLDDPIVAAVAEWAVRVGEDWSGDPAVRVTVTLKDSDIRGVWSQLTPFQNKVSDVAERLFPGHIGSVTFTGESMDLDPDPPAKIRVKAPR